MPGREDRIFYPASLGELHNLLRTEGTFPFYSGRMYPETAEAPGSSYRLESDIISLDEVEELKRISRSDSYIDCGSAVSFSALFNKAGHLLPPVLIHTLKRVYNPAKLCLTTPAGILYSGRIPTPVNLLFNVMEVSYEIRRLKTHRWRGISSVNHWIYHNQLFQQGDIKFEAGDVVLRVRIPSNTWGQAQIRQITLGKQTLYLAMSADISRNYISDFRFSFALEGGDLFRDREKEAHVSGRMVGNAAREVEGISKGAAEKLGWGGQEKLIRSIYNCILNFLYQRSENGA